MQLYQSEIDAGLVINDSIIITAKTRVWTPSKEECERTVTKLIAQANPDQFDLFYLESVLASTGWNLNDDVFDAKELWAAKSTPVDKPFNFMHNESDIIGHITSANVVNFDGKFVNEMSDDFEVIVGSVLYKVWSDKTKRERMDKIIAEIQENKWFVSMECLFRGFDYAVKTPDGQNKVVARNEQTAFLTKHLRIYGGSGKYEDYTLGRLLRNFSFSGKGLVDKPANPRSHITSFNNSKEVTSFSNANEFLLQEKEMSDTVTKSSYDELKVTLDKTQAELAQYKVDEKARQEQTQKDTAAQHEQEVAKLRTEIEANKEVAVAKDAKIASLEKDLVEVKQTLATMLAEKVEAEKKVLQDKRLTALLGKEITKERAEELIIKFATAADDLFSELVKSLPDKKEIPIPADAGKAEDAKKAEDKKKKAEEEEKAAKATEDLEKIEPNVDADLNVNNDLTGTLAAKASVWLSEQILKSTAKLNKGE